MRQLDWYAPAPADVGGSRLTLDFGLRAADLYFRELVVPGIGRVWFVRQLSWPVAALKLHAILKAEHGRNILPSAISQGIEALGCKLALLQEDGERSDRIIGRRAFDRAPDAWDFASLRRSSYYVINTHRQAATRALRVDGGLGLASGSRFNAMTLEPIGEALAGAFLRQGRIALQNWLIGWLLGEASDPSRSDALCRALSPETASANEREIVRGRLIDVADAAGATRRRLSQAIGARRTLDIEGSVIPNLRKAGQTAQANEIVIARAFGLMLDRARDATAALTQEIGSAREGVALAALGREQRVKPRIRALQTAASDFLKTMETRSVEERSARAFASGLAQAETIEAAIRRLVAAAPLLLRVSGSSVVRGAQFRRISRTEAAGEAEDAGRTGLEADFTDRTFRIGNFHELLLDCRAEANDRAA